MDQKLIEPLQQGMGAAKCNSLVECLKPLLVVLLSRWCANQWALSVQVLPLDHLYPINHRIIYIIHRTGKLSNKFVKKTLKPHDFFINFFRLKPIRPLPIRRPQQQLDPQVNSHNSTVALISTSHLAIPISRTPRPVQHLRLPNEKRHCRRRLVKPMRWILG